MKKILALIMALAIAFAAVACTSTPSTTAPEAEATEAAAEATAAPVEEAAAAAEKLMGGEITIGTNVDVATNASWRIRSGQEKLMLGGIYEPLLRFDENGDLQPYLAESVTADQAALTYTVKLREGLTFSDGSALDADALLWNFQNFKENSQTSATHFGDVESFEKTDDLTVVIHLAAWNTQIPYSLNSVAGLMYSKQAFDENGYDWCLENPVGTGPYMLQEVVTDDYKVLVKNPNYWNTEEPATFDTIRFKIIADQMSAQAALLSGEINAYFGGDFQFRDTMAGLGYNVTANKMWYTIYFLIFGSAVEGSPLCDVRVRQAIAYAIDSETIAKTIDYGKSFVSNQYAVEGTPFYSDDVVGYGYDVAKAKELLAEAGYADGFTTKISVGVDQALDRYMIAIQGYLKEVGIVVELDYQETAIWTSKGIYETDGGMILAGHGFGANLVNQAANNFSKRAVAGVGMLKNSKLHPDDLDAVLMNALRATDQQTMLDNMHEAEKLIIDTYCLGYPVVLATSQNLTAQATLIDDGYICSYNEIPVYNNLYLIAE